MALVAIGLISRPAHGAGATPVATDHHLYAQLSDAKGSALGYTRFEWGPICAIDPNGLPNADNVEFFRGDGKAWHTGPAGGGFNFFNGCEFQFLLPDGTLQTTPADPSPSFTDSLQYCYMNHPRGSTGTGTSADCVSNLATVAVTISYDAPKPIATPDYYNVAENGQLSVPAPGFLGNDPNHVSSDTTRMVASVTHGSLTLTQFGGFNYTPAAQYAGHDIFQYQICRPSTGYCSNTTTVDIAVIPPTPVAVDDNYTTPTDTKLVIDASHGLMHNDDNAQDSTANVRSSPQHGTYAPMSDGSFTYTPAAGYSGNDSFTYCLNDTNGIGCDSNVATVTIKVSKVLLIVPGQVNPIIGPVAGLVPKVNDDNYAFTSTNTDPNGKADLTNDVFKVDAPGVLQNDTGTTGLVAILQSQPIDGGTVVLQPNGSFSYAPGPIIIGTNVDLGDSFTYCLGMAATGGATPSCMTSAAAVNLTTSAAPPRAKSTTVSGQPQTPSTSVDPTTPTTPIARPAGTTPVLAVTQPQVLGETVIRSTPSAGPATALAATGYDRRFSLAVATALLAIGANICLQVFVLRRRRMEPAR